MFGPSLWLHYYGGMENPLPENPEQPPSVLSRLAKLLTQFAEQQKPATQAALAKALAVVNDWLSRLQKK